MSPSQIVVGLSPLVLENPVIVGPGVTVTVTVSDMFVQSEPLNWLLNTLLKDVVVVTAEG